MKHQNIIKWQVYFVTVLLLFNTIIFSSQKGGSTAVGLNFYPSAEAAGMGNSYVAVGEGVESVYYNPAGITELENINFITNFTQWIFDIYNMAMSIGYPFGEHKLALSVQYNYIGEMDEVVSPLQSVVNKVTLWNLLTGITYSRKVLSNISVGIQLKNFMENYGSKYNTSSFAIDIGGKINFGNFIAGVSIANVGPPVKINDVSNQLPLNIKIAAGYKITGFKVGIDTNLISDSGIKFNFGGEYNVKGVKLRAGYSQIDEFNLIKGLTFGIGYETTYETESSKFSKSGGHQFVILLNYAISYLNDIGFVHRIGIGGKF